MAVGYLVREVFKETSKWLFQYRLFKKDETEMPTTQMLLWRNEIISPEYHNEIAAKVKETFGRKLPTRKEEEATRCVQNEDSGDREPDKAELSRRRDTEAI